MKLNICKILPPFFPYLNSFFSDYRHMFTKRVFHNEVFDLVQSLQTHSNSSFKSSDISTSSNNDNIA